MAWIAELRDEHRALEQLASALLVIAAAPVPDPASVAALRWGMACRLHDHCAREERYIYHPLIDSDVPALARAGERSHRAFGGIAEMFGRFVADWPVERIAREWRGFGAEAKAVVAALRARIAEEERELYPLVTGSMRQVA